MQWCRTVLLITRCIPYKFGVPLQSVKGEAPSAARSLGLQVSAQYYPDRERSRDVLHGRDLEPSRAAEGGHGRASRPREDPEGSESLKYKFSDATR